MQFKIKETLYISYICNVIDIEISFIILIIYMWGHSCYMFTFKILFLFIFLLIFFSRKWPKFKSTQNLNIPTKKAQLIKHFSFQWRLSEKKKLPPIIEKCISSVKAHFFLINFFIFSFRKNFFNFISNPFAYSLN